MRVVVLSIDVFSVCESASCFFLFSRFVRSATWSRSGVSVSSVEFGMSFLNCVGVYPVLWSFVVGSTVVDVHCDSHGNECLEVH